MEIDQLLDAFVQDRESLGSALGSLSESGKVEFCASAEIKLLERFEQTGSIGYLDRAIMAICQAIALMNKDHPRRGQSLNNLASALQRRFFHTGSMDDIDQAIVAIDQAVENTPNDHPGQPIYLTNLGNALQSRFERTHSMDDLNRAIASTEQAVDRTSSDHPHRFLFINNLTAVLMERFKLRGGMDDLNRTISITEEALEILKPQDRQRSMALGNLGLALRKRFEQTEKMEDLDRAVATYDLTVTSTWDNDPNLAMNLSNLAISLWMRFDRIGRIDDLDKAIKMYEKAVTSTPSDHPNRANRLENLGNALHIRFERTGRMDDLNKAARLMDQALESTPLNHPKRASRLSNLGNVLQSRFEHAGSLDDIDRAITIGNQVLAASPKDQSSNGAKYLINLGNALWNRFQVTGALDDLSQAILLNEEVIAFPQSDHLDRAMALNNMGNVLKSRFERTGAMDDLNRAILMSEKAVALISDHHPNYAMYLNNLTAALDVRFAWTGSMDDLNKAIIINTKAIESTSEQHPDLAMYLNNLGMALEHKYSRTQSIDDLDQAIAKHTQAVGCTPKSHPNRATRLNSLAIALLWRFQLQQAGSMDDLDRAIELNEQAVVSLPINHADLFLYLNNSALALWVRFLQTGVMNEIDKAILMCEKAVELMANDNPSLAATLNILGKALQSRFERLGSTDDMDRAIAIMERAFAMTTAKPSLRLHIASSCSDFLIHQKSYKRAKSILKEAVNVLPTISPRTLKQTDQQHNISSFANITSRAVSLSLADGDEPFETLQLLELGRGIIANLQLEVRSDISVLASCPQHQKLARQFYELRDVIDKPSVMLGSPALVNSHFISDLSVSITDRLTLERFDNLLQQIRSLDGFENFLRGPSKSELHALAKGGPIVVFNVSYIRSDAFLITTEGIRVLHLPLLTSDALNDFPIRFSRAVDHRGLRGYIEAIHEANAVLEWLWDAAVGPILEILGFTQTPSHDEPWPRVWWVGNGPLNLLPIHAAGYHDSTCPKSALDFVISSYAPTLKALLYAHERTRAFNRIQTEEKALLIAMPSTPEEEDLPFVKIEIERLKALFTNASLDTTIMWNPTKASVISALPKHTIVHFACHGHPSNDPSQSSFLLEDWKTELLKVSDITSLNIECGKLAYLSACHTSAMRDPQLLDESISLSSAIQLSGFSSVVGTLWRIVDRHASETAANIYSWMLEDAAFDIGRTAEAVHRAVRVLRNETRRVSGFKAVVPNDPTVWASFIHIGI